MKTLSLLLLAALAAATARADFRRDSIDLSLDYLQNEAVATFETDGVAVTRVKPLCDCITAEIQGNLIIAHIDSSTFSRDITKQLEATTADGKTTTLTIRFSVPPLLVVSSPRLVWKKGAPAAAQEVRLTIPKGSPVRRLERAELVGKTFDYDPRIVREGREYRIIITPRSTEKAVLERLQIVTDCADYRARRTIYLQIKR